MSKFNDFMKSLGIFADKTANKTKELTDTASAKIKIATKEADRDTEYKKLGKLAYVKLKRLKVTDPEALTREISETVEKIDTINDELRALKAEEQAKRDAKKAEKAERAAKKEAEKKAQEEADDAEVECVMDEFNKARREAEEEYEKAKEAAEDVKE